MPKFSRFILYAAMSCSVFCALSLHSPSAYAQGITTGTISGTVADQTGALVPGAQLIAKNVATSAETPVVSNSKGEFTFSAVPIGTYEVKVVASGFAPLTLSSVRVTAGTATGLGFVKLKTGSAVETVEVSTSQNLLETTQSQVTTTFDQEQLVNLPTGGGFDELALLIPGVVSTHGNNRANTNGAGISSNGQRGRSNNFEIDGQSNNDNSVTGPQVFFGNADGLQEVQIITNQFSAQYGRDAGSIVNYITKSGTNTFHGSAFEFYSGSWLNSLTQGQKSPLLGFCAPGQVSTSSNICSPVVKPRYTDNNFGGSFGGPILKDKLFGFGSALFQRNFAGASPSISGPNAQTPTPAGVAALAAAFPNSPGIQSLVKYGPYAVTAGNPTPYGTTTFVNVTDGTTTASIPVSAYSRFLPSYSTDEEILGRLDWKAGPKDRFFARYFYQKSPTIAGSGTVLTGGFVNVNNRTHSVGADWTHTFKANLINQLRYSFQQSALTFDGGGFPSCTVSNLAGCPSSLGISTSYPVPITGGGGSIKIGSFGLGTTYPQGRIVKDTQVQDNATWTVGKHTLAFGGAYEYQNSPNVFLPNISGGFTMFGLNGLVQGTGQVGLAAGNANIHFTEPDIAAYFQDDWRVTPSFTANLGMRWEYFGQSINLLHDLSVANQTGPNPLWNTSLPLSVTTFPKANNYYKHFEPRVGFAYNPASMRALVVRGGYAINIAPAFYNIFLNSYGSAPVVLSTTVTGCSNTAKPCIPTGGANYVSVHAQDTVYIPTGQNPGQFSQTLVSPNFNQPVTQTYDLGVQYAIGKVAVAEVRYVGSHTSHDFQSLNGNPNLAAASAAFPNLIAPSSICTAAASTLPGGVDVGRQHCGQTLVRTRLNTSFEDYSALQTQISTRNFYGVTATLAYTWSRTIDNASEIFGTNGAGTTVAFSQNPLDPNVGERGVSGQSYPNVTSLGLTYKVPFLAHDHSLKGKALSGFQLNTIYLFNSGQPYTNYQTVGSVGGSFCDGVFAQTFAGPDTCRPILANPKAPIGNVGYNAGGGTYVDVATGNTVARSSEHWLFNNQNEAKAIGNPFGGVGRNTLRGNTYNNADMSVFKNNKITERINLQLQFTVFNALNRAYYGTPDPYIGDAGSGFATVQYNGGSNRSTTIGAHILF